MKSTELIERMTPGAIGGAAGSVAMDLMRMAGKATGLIPKRTLPHRLETELEERAGTAGRTNPTQEMALAQAMHIGIGAGFGAAYALLVRRGPQNFVSNGLIYGLVVYALDLLVLGPAFSLTAGPWNRPPLRAGRRLLSHLLCGSINVTNGQ